MIDMALIKCSECGKKVSDTATECPHCGIELQTTNESTINMGIFDYILIGLIILVCVATLLSSLSIMIKIITCFTAILLYLQLKLKREYSFFIFLILIIGIALYGVYDILFGTFGYGNFEVMICLFLILSEIILYNPPIKVINKYDIAIILLSVVIVMFTIYYCFSFRNYDYFNVYFNDFLRDCVVSIILYILPYIGINILNKLGYKSKFAYVLIICSMITILALGNYGLSRSMDIGVSCGIIIPILLYLFTMCKFKTLSE